MSVKKTKKTDTAGYKRIMPSGATDQGLFDLIYDIVRQVPKGRVTSYGAIARAIGSGRSARLVGWAMHSCGSVRPKVPAHRVVNSMGLLSGKHAFKTPTQMEELLHKEGVAVKNNKVVNFREKFWDPAQELI